ncbi:MAG: hypothetical protein ACRBBO_09530 [Cognatishimia sp.]
MTETSVHDPRGLIRESYRIEGIDTVQCRSIFFDWAMDLQEGEAGVASIQALLDQYQTAHPDHPMTMVLLEGVSKLASDGPQRRTGRRRNR